jgi:hypothetical protein
MTRPRIITCPPLELPGDQERAPFWRAELFFHGLDLSGPSYRGALFFNRRRLRHDTPEDAEHGYAGAFFLFGKGGCFGEDPDHCHPRVRQDRFDFRLAHPSHRTVRSVDVTDAVRRELAAGASQIVVSVVPELTDYAGVKVEGDLASPVKFHQLGLVTYDAFAPPAGRAIAS